MLADYKCLYLHTSIWAIPASISVRKLHDSVRFIKFLPVPVVKKKNFVKRIQPSQLNII